MAIGGSPRSPGVRRPTRSGCRSGSSSTPCGGRPRRTSRDSQEGRGDRLPGGRALQLLRPEGRRGPPGAGGRGAGCVTPLRRAGAAGGPRRPHRRRQGAGPAIHDLPIPRRRRPGPPQGRGPSFTDSLTLDDWKWNADLFNKAGEQAKKAGLRFGYHNHHIEFREFGGVTAFDELLRRTDPDLVTIEPDCGWVKVAGLDPADFIAKHASRVGLLHVKDVKARPHPRPVRPGRPVRGGRPRLDRLAQGIRGRQEGGREALLRRAGHHRAAPAGGDQDQPRLPARPEGRVIAPRTPGVTGDRGEVPGPPESIGRGTTATSCDLELAPC